MLTDHTTASIIEAIISMTRILGLHVLAEGVEDQAQFVPEAARLRLRAGLLRERRRAGRGVRQAAEEVRRRVFAAHHA
jgi:predicted signal transduction protein with EAL and GGDEF domain